MPVAAGRVECRPAAATSAGMRPRDTHRAPRDRAPCGAHATAGGSPSEREGERPYSGTWRTVCWPLAASGSDAPPRRPPPHERRLRIRAQWDGFRCPASRNGEFRAVSRRGWDMTSLLPDLVELPDGVAVDGELVAFGNDGLPSFPRLCDRMLHGRRGIEVMLIVFDVLALEGRDVTRRPYWERRRLLEGLELMGRRGRLRPSTKTARLSGRGSSRWAWRALWPRSAAATSPDDGAASRRRTVRTALPRLDRCHPRNRRRHNTRTRTS